MAADPEPESADPGGLEIAADQAIAACGGNPREAVKALIVANEFLEAQAELQATVSNGYARGRFELPPHDRKNSGLPKAYQIARPIRITAIRDRGTHPPITSQS